MRIKRAINRATGRAVWHFVVVASNGEPVATSEAYATRAGAVAGIEALTRAMEDPALEVARG